MNQKEAVEIAIMKSDIKNIGTKLNEHVIQGKADSKDNRVAQEKILKKLDDHMKAINKSLEAKADKSVVKDLYMKYEKINNKIAYWAGAIAVISFGIMVLIKFF